MAGDFETGGFESFICGIESSARRLKYNMEAIIEKYNRPFENDDLINVYSLSICRDKGFLRRTRGSYHFGASKLKSTKRKDELLQAKMKRSLNPNVSMAIEGHYVRHLHDTTIMGDEPSDAETIDSVSSDDEGSSDEEEEYDYGDDDEGEGDKNRELFESTSDYDEDCDDNQEDEHQNTGTDIRAGGSSSGVSDSPSDSSYDFSSFQRGTPFVSLQSPRQSAPETSTKRCASTSSNTKAAVSEKSRKEKVLDNIFLVNDFDTLPFKENGVNSVSYQRLSSKNSGVKGSGGSLQRKNVNIMKGIPAPKVSAKTSGGGLSPPYTLRSRGHSDGESRSIQNSTPQDAHAQKPNEIKTRTSPRKLPGFGKHSNRNDETFLLVDDKAADSRSIQNSTPQDAHAQKPNEIKTRTSPRKLPGFGKHSNRNDETFLLVDDKAADSSKVFTVPRSPVQAQDCPGGGSLSGCVFKSPQRRVSVKRICPTPVNESSSMQLAQPGSSAFESRNSHCGVKESLDGRSAKLSHSKQNLSSVSSKVEGNKTSTVLPEPNATVDLNEKDTSSARLEVTRGSCSSVPVPGQPQAPAKNDTQTPTAVKNDTQTPTAVKNDTQTPTAARNDTQTPTAARNDTQIPRNSITLLSEISFSSSDEEVREDLSESYSLVVDSLNELNLQKSNGGSNTGKPPEVQSSESWKGNNSFTYCFNKLHICSNGSSNRELHFNSVSSPPPKKRNRGKRLQANTAAGTSDEFTANEEEDEFTKCLVSSGLYIESPVKSKQASQNIQQSCTCCTRGVSCCQGRGSSAVSNGFDQNKWTSASSEMGSPVYLKSPVYARLKRKASGSFTSGYSTDGSASPHCRQNVECISMKDSSLNINTNSMLPSAPAECCRAGSRCKGRNHLVEPNHRQSFCLRTNVHPVSQTETSGSSLSQKNTQKMAVVSDDRMSVNPVQAGNSNVGRKFPVVQRRLRSSSRVHVPVETEVCTCSPHSTADSSYTSCCGCMCSKQQNQPSSPIKDHRVCESVRASNGVAGAGVCSVSAPPKRLRGFVDHCSGPIFHQHRRHHHVRDCRNRHSKCAVHDSENNLRVWPLVCSNCRQLKCSSSSQCSVCGILNHVPCMQQSVFCAERLGTTHCKHCICHHACGSDIGQGSGVASVRTLNDGACCQHQLYDCPLHIDSFDHFESGSFKNLDKRGKAVWKDIQAERLNLDVHSDEADMIVSDSVSSNCHDSNSIDLAGKDKTVTDRPVSWSSNCNSHSDIPDISSFLKSGLSRTISGDIPTRSFVEAHSPHPDAALSKNKSFTGIKDSKSGQQSTVMFPELYIEQFSPLNPSRIDWDSSTSAQKEKSLSLRDDLKEGRSGRKNSSVIYHNIGKWSVPFVGHVDHVSSQTSTKNKQMNMVSHSPKRSLVSASRIYKSELSGPSSLTLTKDDQYRMSGTKQNSPLSLLGIRASTPAKAVRKMPELFIDDSVSTIGAPHDDNDDGSINSSVVERVVNVEPDSDTSDDEVSLLGV